ncbi:unnamed protein product [Effrenium voratum]|nr:unnamed protein product [Effrenium voratum]CAJ1452732.1 unnamed protein product [Effrenium voratum]
MSVIGQFRLIVPGSAAKPAPKMGQTLGQLGINMASFCKEFNARTTKVRPDVPLQTTLFPRTDRSYKFFIRSPHASWFLLRAARLPKGSDFGNGAPPVGNITLKELYHIAKAEIRGQGLQNPPTVTITGQPSLKGGRVSLGVTEVEWQFAEPRPRAPSS